jgi:hypothetical protein
VTAALSSAPLVGVLGGGVLKVGEYAAFVGREYLAEYLPCGGAAVKVAVVGDGSAADRLAAALERVTVEYGGLFVSMSAESVRAHGGPALLRDLAVDRLAGARCRPGAGRLPGRGLPGA